jgi:hypothetical protein
MKNCIRSYVFASLCVLIVLLTGCSKSDDPQAQITDPNEIISGTYTMSYLASGNTQYNLPFTNNGITASGQVMFTRVSDTSTSFRMIARANNTTTPLADQTVTVYIKLVNQTTVGLYEEAAMTNQIGTGTKNLIDIKGVDSNGQVIAMKATR